MLYSRQLENVRELCEIIDQYRKQDEDYNGEVGYLSMEEMIPPWEME